MDAPLAMQVQWLRNIAAGAAGRAWGFVLRPRGTAAVDPASADRLPEMDDHAPVERLYGEHSASLVKRLTRQTGCRETARELAQDAFLKLLRMTPARLQMIERPEAYLRAMSAHLAHDWGRGRAVARRALDEAPVLECLDQVALLESRDTLRRLELAIGRLKPRTREIFLAHRLRGMSYAEIAEQTGLSLKGVEKQMSKAIAKIDRYLDRD